MFKTRNRNLIYFLIVALVITMVFPVSVYAERDRESELGYDVYDGSYFSYLINQDNIRESNNLLGEIMPKASEIVESYTLDDDELVYTMDVTDEPSFVTVCEEGTDVIISIDEGNVHNDVIITENNDVVIDGKIVEISEEITEYNRSDSVEASYKDRIVSTTDPLKGKQDYIKQYTNKRTDFHFEQSISKLSCMALAIALTVCGGGVTATILAAAADYVYWYNDTYYKKNHTMSYKVNVYYPENGRRIEKDTLLTKYVGHYYPLEDFEGSDKQKTWYTKTIL